MRHVPRDFDDTRRCPGATTSEAKRIREAAPDLQDQSAQATSVAAAAGKESCAPYRKMRVAFLLRTCHFARVVAILHEDAILLGLGIRRGAPEHELGRKLSFFLSRASASGSTLPHEVETLRAVASLDGEAYAIEHESDAPPGRRTARRARACPPRSRPARSSLVHRSLLPQAALAHARPRLPKRTISPAQKSASMLGSGAGAATPCCRGTG